MDCENDGLLAKEEFVRAVQQTKPKEDITFSDDELHLFFDVIDFGGGGD